MTVTPENFHIDPAKVSPLAIRRIAAAVIKAMEKERADAQKEEKQ